MNKAKRTIQREKCKNVILSHGCAIVPPLYEGDEFRIMFEVETNLGPLDVTLDIEKGSKVFSLFCKFQQAATAKTKFDHWKQNLHEFESENFDLSIDMHLTELLNKANN